MTASGVCRICDHRGPPQSISADGSDWVCKGCGAPVLPGEEGLPTQAAGRLERAPASEPRVATEFSLGSSSGLDSSPGFESLIVGARVANRFDVETRLGAGGMGQVFRAFDQELGERVALKTLQPKLASDAVHLARFRREVQLARKVTHRNVCRVYDLFRETTSDGNDIVFVSMEYLEGETLQRYLQRVRLVSPAEDVLWWLRQVSSGARRGAPSWHRAPGPEAVQHHARRRRRAASGTDGLRAGDAAGKGERES